MFNPSYEEFLDEHKNTIARAIHYSIPFFITLTAAGVLNKFVAPTSLLTSPITVGIMKTFMFWLLGSALVISFSNQTLGHWIASQAFKAISNYGKHAIFDFTNGDKNKQRKLEKKNKESIRNFLLSIVGALLINIVSSVITYFLFQ